MTITIDEIEQELKSLLQGKLVVDHAGNPLYGKLMIVVLNKGRAVGGDCGQDVELLFRKTFQWEV